MVGEPKTHGEKMNKQIVAITMGIFLISLASALTYNITAGESISFMIPETFDYYSIIGNQSEVDLNITQDELNVTIIIGKYSKPDSFEVIFFDEEAEVIHHYSSGNRNSHSSNDQKIILEDVAPEQIILPTPTPDPIVIDQDPPVVDDQEEKPFDKRLYGVFALIIVFLGLVAFWVYVIYKKIKLKNKNK